MLPEALDQRVRRFLEEHLPDGPSGLVVGVSGGADSVCLLHLLCRLREPLGISVHAAHLNHRLRGVESDADARYVAGLARQLGVPLTLESRDVNAYRQERRLSLEAAAREVRYDFLARVAAEQGMGLLAVGHTLDDHVETVLLHLLRGSGTRGLRGLQGVSRRRFSGRELAIIRPLLGVSRAETAAYCAKHRLQPRLDASNLSALPLRNRVRHQLLPLLESYNPQVRAALRRTAGLAAEELDFLDTETEQVWDKVVSEQAGVIILDKKALCQLHPAIQRHLLRGCIARLTGNLTDIEAGHIGEVLEALKRPAGKTITLPEGLTFTVAYGNFLLGRDPAALAPFPPLEDEITLNIPGETRLPGWLVTAQITREYQPPAGEDNFAAAFDFPRTGDRLTVRGVRPGDRFQPAGMAQPKKVGRFMIDARIPRAWRRRIPLVVSPQVIWVVGYRTDERFRATAETDTALRLKFTRQS